MLPNWLYGKSKSKLASILGGGGGTPADYNQVKAQVAQNKLDIEQNTEDIGLLSDALDGKASLTQVAQNKLDIKQNTEDILSLSDALDGKAAKTQITNPNLIHNSWFNINQREQSTYYTSDNRPIYTLDRWIGVQLNVKRITPKTNGGITVDFSSANIQVAGYVCEQIMPQDISKGLCGKTITVSAKLSNFVNMQSVSLRLFDDTSHTSHENRLDDDSIVADEEGLLQGQVTIPSTLTTGHIKFAIYATTEITDVATSKFDVDAVKLEVGSVSTLEMDTAPEYALEFAKCQRYFIRINAPSMFYGNVHNDGSFRFMIEEKMRAAPTVSIYDASMHDLQVLCNQSAQRLTESQTISQFQYTANQVQIKIDTLPTSQPTSSLGLFKLLAGALDLSAEL